jgi:threonine dehydrogenase-like Zn-dependent dehydrogenase
VKVVAWKGPGELGLAEIPDPRPGPGEVLLRVRDCGICGSDLHAAKFGMTLMPGSVLGHEFSGTIAELGEGVEGWRVGDRVAPLPYHSCGTCDRCREGEGMFCPAMRSMGFGDIPGAYAEYALAVPSSLLRLPESVIPPRSWSPRPHAVRLKHAEGRRAIVMGAGPIGLVTALGLRGGRGCVVVSGPRPPRHAQAPTPSSIRDARIPPERSAPSPDASPT